MLVDVFQGQCADLESQGYECMPRSRCDDGYIVNSAIDGDVSSYECPNVRQEYEDDSMGDDMICCRKAEFFQPGIE